MGSGTFNPYQLISACECTASLNELKQSFQGGVFMSEGRNWLLFENVDFGADGSDEFSIPIFSFEPVLPVELWEGNPDDGGIKLMSFEYKAESFHLSFIRFHAIIQVCRLYLMITGYLQKSI